MCLCLNLSLCQTWFKFYSINTVIFSPCTNSLGIRIGLDVQFSVTALGFFVYCYHNMVVWFPIVKIVFSLFLSSICHWQYFVRNHSRIQVQNCMVQICVAFTHNKITNKIGKNQRCGILCATVTEPSLNNVKKQAQQVYSLQYKLSNSISYNWLSLLTHSAVILYLKHIFVDRLLKLSTSSING